MPIHAVNGRAALGEIRGKRHTRQVVKIGTHPAAHARGRRLEDDVKFALGRVELAGAAGDDRGHDGFVVFIGGQKLLCQINVDALGFEWSRAKRSIRTL